MSEIEFSVVVPTRERADTLRSTLQSCLAQDFESYEIVVCDNCSSPETRQAVEAFHSPRIVYHRAPEPLCMRDNWNLAYSFTRGKYVIYIGDDDSLMPFALSQLHAIIQREGARAVRWDSAIYSWPNIARVDLAHHLQVSLARGLKRIDSRTAMQQVLSGAAPATLLPNIYHGCLARSVLEAIRARAGHVFESFHCDTYSSFAAAYLAGEYLSLAAPLSISGFSASSNNIAFNFLRSKHKNTETMRRENAESGLGLHPFVPDLPSGFVCVADSFLRAKADVFPEEQELALDRRVMLERFIAAPPVDDLDEWASFVAELRRSAADDSDLSAWLEQRLSGVAPHATPRDSYKPKIEGLIGEMVCISADTYGVHDVAGATRFAARLIGYNGTRFPLLGNLDQKLSPMQTRYQRARLNLLLRMLRRTRGAS